MTSASTAALSLLAATASPTATVITTLNPDGSFRGSPGILGFFAFLILGIFLILLGLDLTRRARRLRYRNDYAQARASQEQAAAQPAEASGQPEKSAGGQVE